MKYSAACIMLATCYAAFLTPAAQAADGVSQSFVASPSYNDSSGSGGELHISSMPGNSGYTPGSSGQSSQTGSSRQPANSVAQNAPLTTQPDACNRLGMNIEPVTFYSASMPFNDLAIAAQPWHRPWNSKYGNKPIMVDAQGNPLDASPDTTVQSMISSFVWMNGYPTKPYVLTWQGAGVVTPGGTVKIISTNIHQVTFVMTGKNLYLTATTDPSDPVHAIHILPQGMTTNPPLLSTAYLNMIRHFSTLRFMEMEKTNGSTLVHWSDRAHVGDYSFLTKGLPYEYIIAIAQAAHASLWVNIPTLADDDYIRQMAQFFKANMQPWQTVYVEYSNEAWNAGSFPAYNQLKAMGLSWGYPAQKASVQAYSTQVAKVADVWHQVFGSSGYGPQVKVIMGGQTDNPWVLQQAMAFNGNGYKVDAAAVAYYVGGHELINAKNAEQWAGGSSQSVEDGMVGPALREVTGLIKQNMQTAAYYKKPLYLYEGGQNLVAAGMEPNGMPMQNDDRILTLFDQTNRDSGMYGVYQHFLYNWEAQLNSPLYMMYEMSSPYTKYGYWGLLQSQGQAVSNAPKLNAVYDFCKWQ